MKCVFRINISFKIRIYYCGHRFLNISCMKISHSHRILEILLTYILYHTSYINITKSKTTHLKEEKSQMSKTTTQLLPYLVTTILETSGGSQQYGNHPTVQYHHNRILLGLCSQVKKGESYLVISLRIRSCLTDNSRININDNRFSFYKKY